MEGKKCNIGPASESGSLQDVTNKVNLFTQKIKQTNSLVEPDLFATDFRLFFVTPGSLSSRDL